MPNPSAKVAAMASIFQQQAVKEKDEENITNEVKKGRRSLPEFREAGVAKHKKTGLKRTNSQKERFSSAKLMFEKKGSSGDNLLDTSRSSINSNSSRTVYSTRLVKSVSSVSGEEEDDEANQERNDLIKVVDNEVHVELYKLSCKENIPHSKPPLSLTTSSHTSQSQVLSPNRQLKTAGHIKSVPRDFLELNSKSSTENSPPPPLPSLPPPPLLPEDKPGEGTLLFSSLEQPATTVSEAAELFDSLPSDEDAEMLQEFDKLADMTDLGYVEDQADDEHSDEVGRKKGQVTDDTNKQVLENIHMSNNSILSLKSNTKDLHISPDFTRSSCTSGLTTSVDIGDDEITGDSTKSLPLETAKTEDQTKQNLSPKNLDENQNKSISDKSHTASEDGNTSSLGSSLVGQSVTSWLGTPGSVAAQSISTGPSPGTGGHCNNSKHVQSTEESSDYVSGDSCELGSSSSPTVELKPSFPRASEWNPGQNQLNYLSDGNFWVEGPPLVPTSELEDTAELYHSPTMVKFSTAPVRIYSTYTEEEYDRSNDDIDPAAASAEYELEKRVEKMETFEVSLTKGESGLGLSILGMGVGVDTGVEKLGIFIKTITAGGAADKDGRIQVNDQIISVDGSCLVGVTQAFAATVLRNTAGLVQFVVGREKEPGESEVAQLIRESVQAEEEEEEHAQADMEEDSSEVLSVSASSSAEGELSISCELREEEDSEEVCRDTLAGYEHPGEMRDALGNESTDNVNNYGDVDVLNESSSPDINAEQKGVDSSESPEEDVADTSMLNLSQPGEKSAVRDAKPDEPEECCPYKEKYKALLSKYEEAQDSMGQMTRNMSIVSEQLLSREQLFSSHMARLREVFSQLEEELRCTDQEAASQQSIQSLKSALELRGVLGRKPFIPTQQPALSPSSLDLAIPPTPVLDTSLARARVSLVHRATLPRRRGRQNMSVSTSSTGQADLSGLRTVETGKGVGGSDFKDQLRKTLMKNMRSTLLSECEGKSGSRTPPLSPNRASSLPSSPTLSQYSSSSSLHSVPGSLDGLSELKREKKRMSGKSLWQKARRRLSSR